MSNNKKNKKIIYLGLSFFAVLLSVFLVISAKDNVFSSNKEKEDGKEETRRGILFAEEKYFDFGNISMKNGEVSRGFKVENRGEGALVINKIYTSCMCTSAFVITGDGVRRGPFSMPGHGGLSKTNIEIPAGKSALIEAIFDPAAHGPSGVGIAERSIYIETNFPDTPRLELSFKAAVSR